jgi:quaternary ammonium compound-resistance protein SugE
MAWVLLAASAAFDVGFVVLLKMSNAFERWQLGVVSIACMLLALVFLSLAIRTIPITIAFPVWTGMGLAGTVLLGLLLLHERLLPIQVFGLALIAAGVVVLQISSPA